MIETSPDLKKILVPAIRGSEISLQFVVIFEMALGGESGAQEAVFGENE